MRDLVHDLNKVFFASHQESVQKDIECAFGILVQHFHVLARPLQNWYIEDIENLVYCCVILHNMIVEERKESGLGQLELEAVEEEETQFMASLFWGTVQQRLSVQERNTDNADAVLSSDVAKVFLLQGGKLMQQMENKVEHFSLKDDLIVHINDMYSK